MPDKRTHRGRHPEDARLFALSVWPLLKQATQDLSELLTKGYALKSSLKLVGDHYSLTQRQRIAIMRSSCADQDWDARFEKENNQDMLSGQVLLLDGYNIITTIEASLAGGVILRGRDKCLRDIAGMHGTYRKVEETIPAITLIGQEIASLDVMKCICYLDTPVSNSGRLKTLICQIASEQGWNWQVELVNSPDGVLARTEHIVVTSDSVILNRCRQWFNLSASVIDNYVPSAYIVDLS